MSKNRTLLDYYPTPWCMTKKIFDFVPSILGGIVFDPCAGDGYMSSYLEETGRFDKIITNDINPKYNADFNEDATKEELWNKVGLIDWVIVNPPFSSILEIVEYASKFVKFGMCIFARLTWLEPTILRGPWLIDNPINHIIVLPRIRYDHRKHRDTVTRMWCIWIKWQKTQNINYMLRSDLPKDIWTKNLEEL